jgi:hypothetical protein
VFRYSTARGVNTVADAEEALDDDCVEWKDTERGPGRRCSASRPSMRAQVDVVHQQRNTSLRLAGVCTSCLAARASMLSMHSSANNNIVKRSARIESDVMLAPRSSASLVVMAWSSAASASSCHHSRVTWVFEDPSFLLHSKHVFVAFVASFSRGGGARV